jgi:hypothetical protein
MEATIHKRIRRQAMTLNEVMAKWTYEANRLIMSKPDNTISSNLAQLKASIINEVLQDIKTVEPDASGTEFKCDYLRTIPENIWSIPRCMLKSYCDPRGCKEREVQADKPSQAQVESFWEDSL